MVDLCISVGKFLNSFSISISCLILSSSSCKFTILQQQKQLKYLRSFKETENVISKIRRNVVRLAHLPVFDKRDIFVDETIGGGEAHIEFLEHLVGLKIVGNQVGYLLVWLN